ncbi:hypothetical protein Tco_0373513 [Tanacetum coccineum]|uniref:Uncharacterized protein n=1 Tax=Tanacetum coccineum TaxID=301880 RepID=A0ABQ5EGQ4_9ASTR
MNVTPPDAYSDGTLFGGVTDWYLEPKDSSEENVVTPSGRVLWFVGSLHCRKPSHSSSAGPSRKRSRSPTTLVPLSSPVPGALSFVRVDLLPPHKRIRSSDSAMDLEDCSDESSKFKQRLISVLHMRMLLELRGIHAKVMVETAAREEVETSMRGMVEVRVDKVTHPVVLDDILEPAQEEGAIGVAHETLGDMVQRFHDHTVEVPVHRVQVIESIQRDQGYRIIAAG